MNIENLPTLPPVEIGFLVDPFRPVIPLSLDVRRAACHAPHRHPRGQLIYAGKGVMRVVSAARRWVVPPTQAIWVPPDAEHMVYFPGEVSLRNLFVNPSAVDGLPETCVALRVSPLLRELVLRAGSLENEYPVDGPIWRLMQVILDELRQAEASELQLPLAQDERLQCVLGALLENPGDSRPIEAWAKQACVSPRTLARLFVRETGMTFGRWRRQARLLEAVDRLGAGEPIARVAFELGYASQSAFTEMFRRSLGVPPAQYTRAAEEPC